MKITQNLNWIISKYALHDALWQGNFVGATRIVLYQFVSKDPSLVYVIPHTIHMFWSVRLINKFKEKEEGRYSFTACLVDQQKLIKYVHLHNYDF